MNTPSECPHESFKANVAVGRMLDTGGFMADIMVQCAECGEPFRFIGVPAGLDFAQPMCSIDGLELRAPIEPQGRPALATKALFVVPNIPTHDG